MSDITKVFNYGDKVVRTVVKDNDIWFVAKDVAEVLEYVNTKDAISSHVDIDDKQIIQKSESTTFEIPNRGLTIINESGVYSLIISSKLPEAKKFKKWVTSEVLPSIRKHGAYMTAETIENAILNPDTLIKLATTLKEEQEKRKLLETKIKEDERFTNFGKQIASTEASINLGSFVKILQNTGVKIGRNKFFEWLRKNGYLMRTEGEWNEPKQQYVNQGLFSVKESFISTSSGAELVTTTLLTGKGQEYFVRKLKELEESK
jgi:prophage antirepressor-like protein